MFGFFSKKTEKREVEQLKQAVQTGFNSVKQDVGSLTRWVKHLDTEDNRLKEDIFDLRTEIASMKEEIENVKNIVSIIGEKPVFKQKQPVFNKQTAVGGVLNTVQTAVQTAFLDNLSTTERAIIFVLLNSDMKMSYEDLAAMLGKTKATIRGQINVIKQKSDGLIEEIIAENNKKRVYIPDRIKEVLLKSKKIREKDKRKIEEGEY
jgi:predicted transcriptional regulator